MPLAYESYEQGRCLGCNYPLRGLTTFRCPECGRPFDPVDPTTYFHPARKSKRSRFDLWARPALVGGCSFGLVTGVIVASSRGVPPFLIIPAGVVTVIAGMMAIGWRENDDSGCGRAATAFLVGFGGIPAIVAVSSMWIEVFRSDLRFGDALTATFFGALFCLVVWIVALLFVVLGMALKKAIRRTA